MIFERYVALASVMRLKDELERKNIRTRSHTSGSNRRRGGCLFGIGHLRHILKNPIYVGDIVHKGTRHKGKHPATVSRKLFEAVQTQLAASGQQNRTRPNAKNANLLAGMFFEEGGNRFTSDHAVKNGKRYRYYVARPEGSAPIRIPAADLELLVTNALAEKLRDASWVVHNLTAGDTPPDQLQEAVHEAASLANEVQHKLPRRQREAVHQLISRIVVQKGGITIHLAARAATKPGDHSQEDESSHHSGPRIEVPGKLIRRGADPRLIIPGQEAGGPQINRALVKAIARAVTGYDDLVSGRAASMREIAEREEVNDRFVVQQLHLAFLASDLIEQSVEGRVLVRSDITSLSGGLDLLASWAEQRSAIG